MDRVSFRTELLHNHLTPRSQTPEPPSQILDASPCLSYTPPELNEQTRFDTHQMRVLLGDHNLADRDWLVGIMTQSKLFNPRKIGSRVSVSPDYNQTMEQQREITMQRILYMLEEGVFKGWLTSNSMEDQMRMHACLEIIGMFDHSLSTKLGVHFHLWGGAVQFLGTKRHHDKWLRDTENYVVKGCFSMTELGHGSNVRGIETVTTYDSKTGEFVINTPCESAQKYWIGGAALHATYTIAFSQLHINGTNQGVHAFIVRIRDENGNICPNVRIADCGHKIGLNGVDNGRIWFDNVRVPRENLLNSVADVSPDGQYLSPIKDPDQRFGAFLAPLTSGRVSIAILAVYIAKVGITTAIRYSLTRRAFSVAPNKPEVLLLDYPSHQRRLLPLLAKTYAMSVSAHELKMLYRKRTPEDNKTIHVVSSAYKATFTWHNMRTLQECREACGGQGLKTLNRIGQLTSEFDVQSTFEGDNNVLMQQISKALFAENVAVQKQKKPFKGWGLEHMNGPPPVIPSHLSNSTLRSSQFQIDVFRIRERDLLRRFVEEVSKYLAQGQSKEYAFNMSCQLAEDLGRAFAERKILQSFIEAEETPSATSLEGILGLLRSMYALISMEEDATFLRYGYLSTENAAEVRKEVLKLCTDIRPHALALVNSFGIPDAFLGPIAFDWVEADSWSNVHH